jgi:hypothetical protein
MERLRWNTPPSTPAVRLSFVRNVLGMGSPASWKAAACNARDAINPKLAGPSNTSVSGPRRLVMTISAFSAAAWHDG